MGGTGDIAGIGPDDTASDLIPGNLEKLEHLAASLRAYAGAFHDARTRLKSVHEDDWQGAAAIDFRSAVRHIPETLDAAHEQFDKAGKAVERYAEVLADARQKAKPVVEDASDARARSKTYQQDVDDYNKAVEKDDGTGSSVLPPRPPEEDPSASAMAGCVARINSLRARVDEAAHAAKKKLDEAAEAAPDEPGWFKKLLGGVGNLGKGLYEGVSAVNTSLDTLVHPNRWGMSLANTKDSLIYGAQHPVEFLKSATNWEMLTTEPMRWIGNVGSGAALAAATGGAGGAAAAARRLGGRVDGGRKGHKGRDDTDGRPDDVCRQDGDKCKAGEPVDVATGEMSLTHVDLTLPGAFPLTLRRTHLSSYGAGGWFGLSWAATLDQHLEVDERGIVLATEDGMLLAYPLPHEAGAPVLPERGPRRPLEWDGRTESEVRVSDPVTGRVLCFGHQPATGEWPLTGIEDRARRRVEFRYDPESGRPTDVHHPGGTTVRVTTHPELPRITALHVGDECVAAFGYDAAGNLTEELNSSGLPLTFTYDEADRITSWTDRNGSAFGYVYDRSGRVLRTVGPDGMWSGSFRYEPGKRRTTYTDSLGHATTYTYDGRYRPTSITDPLGAVTRQGWTLDGRHLSATTDPLGHTTRYRYDDVGNLVHVELPDGSHSGAVYDDRGLPLLVTQPGGATWQHTYDGDGNRTSTTDPSGATTRYAYDSEGHPASVTDALGHTQHTVCDSSGLPVSMTTPDGYTTTVTRDALGRPVELTDPRGGVTKVSWTVEGRPAQRRHPDGSQETWQWDAEGNLLAHTDPMGGTTRYTYTHFDLVASRTGPDGAEFSFAYDTELRLTTVTHPMGLTWDYAYDAVGRLRAESDFNDRSLAYTHDPAGRLGSRTNGAGETITYARDALGRLSGRRADNGAEVSFAYAPDGRLTALSSPDADIHRSHDVMGRPLTETVNGRTTSFTYDPLGRCTSRTTPSGHTSTWTWGPGDRPEGLSTPSGRLTFGYDPAGHEIYRMLGDETALLQTWDVAGRMTMQSLRTSGGDPLQEREYTYRPDGHVTALADSHTGTRRYDLTPTGRVSAVHGGNWTETYAYDAAGNVSADSEGPRTLSGTLLHRTRRTRYAYDAQGRLVRRTRRLLNGQTRAWTYAWDAEDRLTEATTPSGDRWRYSYDPAGRRVAKRRVDEDGTALESVHFTWDGTRLAEQTSSDGTTLTWDYAPGTYRPVAQSVQEPGPAASDPRLAWSANLPDEEVDSRFYAIVTDLVGTPTELVDESGTVTWRHRTTLWGDPLDETTDPSACPLRFPGQYADPETGLHYNNQRYYDPETARFLTPDPLGLDPADNHHSYVANPLAWIDPLGLESCAKDVRDEFRSLPNGEQSGRVKTVDNEGELRSLFDKWTDGAEQLPSRGPKVPEVYKLDDGTIIQWRLSSGSGGETIDMVYPESKKPRKVHIKQEEE
ncbi:putative T7SS-secreted protein [Streptomyces sp. HNM0574]|uniref:putative T7SS-secreted protein n=1 Tax=Streptomyces sp. HNM0574 TaxID=2714954 RepID=UPI001469F081|nr:DUF6531 domain-containing protein [Streptomyces sp. HNM0574]NLU68001.1 type IV secretion protein Rhs [Streptomyces sp. HNM0574]